MLKPLSKVAGLYEDETVWPFKATSVNSILQDTWLGRSTEITRDELKFTKFVQKLRKKFIELFNDILKTQLVLKGIIAEEEWPMIRDNIFYDFLQDGHFAELKQAEMLKDRIQLANDVRDYVGKYFSVEYVRKNILKQSDQDIEKIDSQIKKEIDDGIISSPQGQVVDSEDSFN